MDTFQEIFKDFTLKEVLPLREVCKGWERCVQEASLNTTVNVTSVKKLQILKKLDRVGCITSVADNVGLLPGLKSLRKLVVNHVTAAQQELLPVIANVGHSLGVRSLTVYSIREVSLPFDASPLGQPSGPELVLSIF